MDKSIALLVLASRHHTHNYLIVGLWSMATHAMGFPHLPWNKGRADSRRARAGNLSTDQARSFIRKDRWDTVCIWARRHFRFLMRQLCFYFERKAWVGGVLVNRKYEMGRTPKMLGEGGNGSWMGTSQKDLDNEKSYSSCTRRLLNKKNVDRRAFYTSKILKYW